LSPQPVRDKQRARSYHAAVPRRHDAADLPNNERPTVLASEASLAHPVHAGATVLQHYQLDRLLGAGGMGEVWAGRHIVLDKAVALKVLRSDGFAAHTNDRLLREARAVARLHHPNIVQVHEFGVTESGVAIMVMELLQGEDLGRRMRRVGTLCPLTCSRLFVPVFDALEAAHAAGIVHRDLKPDNIFVVPCASDLGFEPKVVDFGIAHLSASTDPRITTDRAPLGTPFYMAPEQILCGAVDARVDVWAACVTMYEAIAGKLPFNGSDSQQLFSAILHAPLPFPTHMAQMDGELFAILARGVRKAPSDRWESAAAVRDALTTWLLARGVRDDASGRTLRSPRASSGSPTPTDDRASAPSGSDREGLDELVRRGLRRS
jgi:serine/threonine-protein kinase